MGGESMRMPLQPNVKTGSGLRARRRRRSSGFTLVELMIVVAILGIMAALAVFAGQSVRGDKGPAFARNVVAISQEARHAALALSQPTRLTLSPTGTTMTITSEVTDQSGTWTPLGGVTKLPIDFSLCKVDSSVTQSTTTPTCPLTATTWLCFDVNGRVVVRTSDGACPRQTNLGNATGATIYAYSNDGKNHKYKLFLFGITGMPKLTDTW